MKRGEIVISESGSTIIGTRIDNKRSAVTERSIAAAAVAVAATLITGSAATATVITYDGNAAGGTVLSAPANWNPDGVPLTSDQATFTDAAFGATLPVQLTTATSLTWGSLIWNSNATSTITTQRAVTGNKTLTLTAAGGSNDLIQLGVNMTSGTLTISSNDGIGTGTPSNGALFVTAGATGGTAGNINVVNSGATLIFGAQFNLGNVANFVVTKTGAGTVTFNNGNNAGGAAGQKFVLDGGTLNFGSVAGFGGSTGTTLEIHAGTSLDTNGATADIVLSKNYAQTYTGDFTYKATSSKSLNLGTGAVTLSGGTRQITVSANTLSLGGAVGDEGNGFGLTKAGAGTLILAAGNTYSGATTVSAGTLTLGTGSTAGSLNTASAITTNGTFTVNRNNAVVQGTDFSGAAIGGSGGLTFIGGTGATGALTLNAANAYNGTTTLTSGTLNLDGTNSGAGATTVTAGTLNLGAGTNGGLASGTINFNGGTIKSSSAAARVATNAVLLGGTGTIGAGGDLTFGGLTLSNSRTLIVNNGITAVSAIGQSATGYAFTKQGAGALTVNGATTYTGATQIDAGILAVGGTFGTGGNLKINGGVLGTNGTYNKNLGTGGGQLTFPNSGGFAAYGLAAGFNAANNLTVNIGNAAATQTFGGTNFLASGKTLILGSTVANGTVTFANGLNLANASQTIQADRSALAGVNGVDAVVSGAIASGGLTKTGGGVLSLTSNSNSYTGATNISEGTLLVNGSLAAGSAVTLGANGALGGSGAVNGTVNVAGTLTPGNSPGTLTTGAETWVDGGDYNFQIANAAGAAGTGYDTIAITGGLDLSGLTAGGFDINLWTLSSTSPDVNGNAANFNSASNYSFVLATTTAGITGFNPANFDIFTTANNGAGGFSNPYTGTFSVATSGNDLVLNYSVPEPASLGVLAVGGIALLGRRRRSAKFG